MHEQFLIKHAVGGRTFIDSDRQSIMYTAEMGPENSLWSFTVADVPDQETGELLKWKSELNVFLFRSFEDDRPTVKIWFYVQDSTVTYDRSKRRLSFSAKSHIEYVPQQFGYM